ncbi:MAG: hypothetical protein M3070_04830 [Actinomycetota bacterium]|nr:hypothetical protein [Actinomycetota bacterium]
MSAEQRVTQPRLIKSFSHRDAARRGEVRLPASLAVVLAAVSHALLPNSLLVEPRWLLSSVEIALLVPLVAINPTRMTNETRWSRNMGLLLTGVVIVTNLIALSFLLRNLATAHITNGRELLLAALQVWLTNIVAFALVFWDLDRGGAVARLPASDVPARRADFLFPQDSEPVAKMALGTDGDASWIPVFVDYLFVSITNSTAFSPTDTMPLTSRAKLLMSLQALAAMITSLLVIARAVNVLK